MLAAPDGAQRRRFMSRLAILFTAAAAGALVDDGVAWRRLVADHRTDIGKQAEVVLDAQTRLLLNTRTAIDVAAQDASREVRLLSGELLVRQGSGAAPLVVRTPQGRIQARNARFAVRHLGEDTVLNVLQGSAEVLGADHAGGTLVPAGQGIRLSHAGAGTLHPVQDTDIAWINGQILAHDMKLADFIDELQRYSPDLLQYDPQVANLPVSGRFPLNDVQGVFNWLSSTLPLRVDVVDHQWGRPLRHIRSVG